jgi:hypothetical protein
MNVQYLYNITNIYLYPATTNEQVVRFSSMFIFTILITWVYPKATVISPPLPISATWPMRCGRQTRQFSRLAKPSNPKTACIRCGTRLSPGYLTWPTKHRWAGLIKFSISTSMKCPACARWMFSVQLFTNSRNAGFLRFRFFRMLCLRPAQYLYFVPNLDIYKPRK